MRRVDSWQDRTVNPILGQLLFSFALIADTHVDRDNQPSSSPFPVNALANARTRYCVADINRLGREMGPVAPRFAVHLGDLIHPVPSMPSYAAAADDFHRIVRDLDIPLHVIPGNHDVGDKPVDWAPAGVVRDDYLELWNQLFGAQYQAFEHGGIRFILINAQIINSGLDLETEQRQWLTRELELHGDGRVMLFLHYPPYICTPDEPENYDNLAEPGRSWITSLIERYRVEAMFTGHVHHFWYHRHADTDCYLLPSTSFTRQDYSEMFRAPPPVSMQDGRDDNNKTGYFVVLVYENGHVCHFRSTGGGTLDEDAATGPAEPVSRVVPVHTRERGAGGIGFDLRHPWAELIDIAPSGALDEFRRKRVRNDYPLLALWQMGVVPVRVPVDDLGSDRVVARMGALKQMGHRFVALSQGLPAPGIRARLAGCRGLVERVEITLPMSKVDETAAEATRLREEIGVPVYLSKLRMKSDVVREGAPYFHLISHGFTVADEQELRRLLGRAGSAGRYDGIVFRIGRTELPEPAMAAIGALCDRLQVPPSITLFMADDNPARHRRDDLDNANRIAEAVVAASALKNGELFVDTFMDMDRGHCVRNGVIDRLCNPRPALFVVRHLNALINSRPGAVALVGRGVFDGGRWIRFDHEGRSCVMLLPDRPLDRVVVGPGEMADSTMTASNLLDLVNGEIGPMSVARTNGAIELTLSADLKGPAVIMFESRV